MSNGCPATRSTLERLCQARRARRAARRLREQQRHGPKVPSNLDILERHTREVLRRLEVGPLEEVSRLLFRAMKPKSMCVRVCDEDLMYVGCGVLCQGSWEAQQSVNRIRCCRVFG